MPANDDDNWPKTVEEWLEIEVKVLRRDFRRVVALIVADPSWFRGSESQRGDNVTSALCVIVMSIRKLMDSGKRKRGASEPGLVSLAASVSNARRHDLVKKLRKSKAMRHVLDVADYANAHNLPMQLVGVSRHIPGLSARAVRADVLAELVNELSRAYLVMTGGSAEDLDHDIPHPDDPWEVAVRQRGVPLIDFEAVESFHDPADLKPFDRQHRLLLDGLRRAG